MKKYLKILIIFCIFLCIFTINVFATEEGKVLSYNGITTKMPKISDEIIEEEDPINISRDSAKSNFEVEAFAGIDNENVSNIISKFANTTTVVGIDVSRHQKEIDWKQVANSGVKFAIIRCGYRGTTYGGLFEDPYFDQNVKGALANGIYVGVYFYSTALNEEEALQEADLTYNKIKNYEIKYPVYYDFEDFLPDNNRTDNLDVAQINSNARIFINYLKSKGYNAAIYGSANYLKNKWEADITNNNDVWVAHYYVNKPNYQGNYQMWQYTDKAYVPGINVNVDVNIDYYYWINMKGSISGIAHVQNIGWDQTWKYNTEVYGTIGKGKRLEAIKLKANSISISGGIQYKAYVEENGWEKNWKKDGEISGTTNQGKRIEAFQIKLTGNLSKHFDIYYRAHCQYYGWLGWAKNGESAGTEFLNKRLEAIQIMLVEKNGQAPGSSENRFRRLVDIRYNSHVQGLGWINYVVNGDLSGSTGRGLRMEAMHINLVGAGLDSGIEYKSHIQGFGWESIWKKDGELTGTQGLGKRMEAIQIRLTGKVANSYDIYYRVHSQGFGWLGWAKNGESAGTQGLGKRLEAIEILLIAKGNEVPSNTANAFRK